MKYTEQQIEVIKAIIKNEFPISAKQLVSNYGFNESYITSALPRMADRGILIREGKSLPVNGRAGHIMWMLSNKTKREFGTFPTTSIKEVSPLVLYDIANRDKVYSIIEESDMPCSKVNIASKLSNTMTSDDISSVLDSLLKKNKIVLVGETQTESCFISKSLFDKLNKRDYGFSLSFSKCNKPYRKGTNTENIRNFILTANRPVNLRTICKNVEVEYNVASCLLTQLCNSKALHSHKINSAYGKMKYWSAPHISPPIIKPL